MTTEMVPADFMFPVSQYDDKALDKLSERDFFPYVKLITPTSKEGKSGAMKMNTYVLFSGKDSSDDLGTTFNALVLARKPRASRKTVDGIESFYDMESKEFKKIQADQAAKKLGNWWGPDFLIWVEAIRRFACYHASSITARNGSGELIGPLKDWINSVTAKKSNPAITIVNPQVTFKTAPMKGGGQDYIGPVFTKCSTPFAVTPTWDEIRAALEKFNKKPVEGAETADTQVEERG